jgi:hypothetical protein
MEALSFLAAHWMAILLGIQGVLAGVLAIALVIPGDQPDKALQAIVDFISQFSKK